MIDFINSYHDFKMKHSDWLSDYFDLIQNQFENQPE